MDGRYHYHGPEGQPGLEVTHQPGLEVATHENLQHGQSLLEVRPDEYAHAGKESVVVTKYPGASGHYSPLSAPYSAQEPAELATQGPDRRKKRLWIVVGCVTGVIVILAAVLGGIFGSRAARSSSADGAAAGGASGNPTSTTAGPGPSITDGPGSNITTRPQSIRQGSRLSVTGWRKPDGSAETFLFYQDSQDGLRYSRCDASRRSPGNDATCWNAPVGFNSSARAGTPLAASTILWSDQFQPQLELFYSGFKTRLMGVGINEQVKPNTTDDSVNEVQIFTGIDSGLTAYWPWTIYQDGAGVLFHVRNRLGGGFAPASNWDNNKLNITAMTASRLAIVPMSANFDRIAVKGGYAIFYQAPDSKLAVAITDLNSPQLAEDYPLSWQPAKIPSITLPKLAPLAGLSVARRNDSLQRVDTYLLYLDADANINVLYTKSSSSGSEAEWKTSQPQALKGVDPDTDIACLTMATSPNNAARTAVPLEEASNDTRCYFQKRGLVTEARLNAENGDWVVVGNVPMP